MKIITLVLDKQKLSVYLESKEWSLNRPLTEEELVEIQINSCIPNNYPRSGGDNGQSRTCGHHWWSGA